MSTQITATGGDSEPRRNAAGGGFFSLYKSGQGYWTRLGTAIGAAAIILFIGWFTFTETTIFPALTAASRRYAIAAGVVAVLALVGWWIMNAPRRAQFLVDTDSEMKKVNWASWPELVGSTRVVVFFMLLTALTLFIFDTQFHAFFYSLGVWHIPFAEYAGIVTGAILSIVLIMVGVALVKGGESKAAKFAAIITLSVGLAAFVAWALFTIHTLRSGGTPLSVA
jgi:preprotein translocase subunit SecE